MVSSQFGQGNKIDEDHHLLARELYRHVRNHTLVNDSFFKKWPQNFPAQREGGEFVVGLINEVGNPQLPRGKC
jgi:hypothetical protein